MSYTQGQSGYIVYADCYHYTTGAPLESDVTVDVISGTGTYASGLGSLAHRDEGHWSYTFHENELSAASVTARFSHDNMATPIFVTVEENTNPTAVEIREEMDASSEIATAVTLALAVLAGKCTVNQANASAVTATYYDTDGSTPLITVTYGTSGGVRTGSSIL
jgi:hypothetical protein